MHRINLTIDEDLCEEARAVGFLERKSVSQIVRESLRAYLTKSDAPRRGDLLLSAKDKKEALNIMRDDAFISSAEFKKKHNL